ncbi:MAG: prepilin-type N-terminal cleavage/methylation domain-containing protein [Candidatus Vogelbacteria bacterium]|nr:prepilin-type N-terminal cleavage/methylation domain-containing protein [Candidatus Vogelbacteria bacterium]
MQNAKRKIKSGFTLIELLVVIAIISLLSSIVLASLGQARDKAKIAKVKAELVQIRTAMELFLEDKGELPPIGAQTANCSACDPIVDCTDLSSGQDWETLMTEFTTGRYMTSPIPVDPWGNPFCYDDNYKIPNCTLDTPLWSMGPDGIKNTPWPQDPIPYDTGPDPVDTSDNLDGVHLPYSQTTFTGDDIGIVIFPEQCQCRYRQVSSRRCLDMGESPISGR